MYGVYWYVRCVLVCTVCNGMYGVWLHQCSEQFWLDKNKKSPASTAADDDDEDGKFISINFPLAFNVNNSTFCGTVSVK